MQHKLIITRGHSDKTTTLGQLDIDEEFFCFTLELPVMPSGPKVPSTQAIPYGDYWVIVTFSDHFQKRLPLIYNQDDLSIVGDGRSFAGVRFHGGNTFKDTEACVIVAHEENLDQDLVWNSASDDLVALLDNGEIHSLTITQ